MSLYDEFTEKLESYGIIEKDWGRWGYPDCDRVVELNCHEFSEKGESGFLIMENVDDLEVYTIAYSFEELLLKLRDC